MVHSLKFQGLDRPPVYSSKYIRTSGFNQESRLGRGKFWPGVKMEPVSRADAFNLLSSFSSQFWIWRSEHPDVRLHSDWLEGVLAGSQIELGSSLSSFLFSCFFLVFLWCRKLVAKLWLGLKMELVESHLLYSCL